LHMVLKKDRETVQAVIDVPFSNGLLGDQ